MAEFRFFDIFLDFKDSCGGDTASSKSMLSASRDEDGDEDSAEPAILDGAIILRVTFFRNTSGLETFFTEILPCCGKKGI